MFWFDNINIEDAKNNIKCNMDVGYISLITYKRIEQYLKEQKKFELPNKERIEDMKKYPFSWFPDLTADSGVAMLVDYMMCADLVQEFTFGEPMRAKDEDNEFNDIDLVLITGVPCLRPVHQEEIENFLGYRLKDGYTHTMFIGDSSIRHVVNFFNKRSGRKALKDGA